MSESSQVCGTASVPEFTEADVTEGRKQGRSAARSTWFMVPFVAAVVTSLPIAPSLTNADEGRPVSPPRPRFIRLLGHENSGRQHFVTRTAGQLTDQEAKHCVPKDPPGPRCLPATPAPGHDEPDSRLFPAPGAAEDLPAIKSTPKKISDANPATSSTKTTVPPEPLKAKPANLAAKNDKPGATATSIRDRMQYMRNLLERQRQEKARRKHEASQAQVAEENANDPPGPPVAGEEADPRTETPDVPRKPATDLPVVVTESPVNRMKLADSLFGAGDTELAQRVYSQLPLKDLAASDRTWVQFQLASCHRRLGRVAEAEKLYRVVASYSDAGALGETSRWWLDRIHARRQLTKSLKQINATLAQLEAATNAP